MQRLILITNGFPFGNSERSFLLREFYSLIHNFDLVILARETEETLSYPISESIPVYQYKLSSHATGNIFKRIWKIGSCIIHKPVLLDICKAMDPRMKKGNRRARIKQIMAYYLDAMQIEQRIIEISETREPDIIYTYWCNQATVAALNLKRKWEKLKVVTRFHGADLYEERKKDHWQPLRDYIAKQSDKLVFACEAGKTYFLSRWGRAHESKAVVSFLGCAPQKRLDINFTKAFCLVSCSNMISLKRIDYIIEALSKMPDDVPVVWHHFGDGDMRQSLEAYAKKLLDRKKLVSYHFWGYIMNEELNKMYQQIGAQLFITTSETEGGVPVSLQEAFAMGLPAVGTAVGGIPEMIVPHKTGFLLPPNPSIEQVTDALMQYYRSSVEDKQAMSTLAYKHWEEHYDADKNAQHFVEMLRSL